MSEQENTTVVRRGYENFKTGNIQALLSDYSENVEWVLPEIRNVPFSGKRRGLEQLRQFFAMLGEQQEVLDFQPQEYVAQGDKVVVLGHYSWRVKSTGRTLQADWAHVFTIRAGRIVRFQEYTDTGAAMAAYQKA